MVRPPSHHLISPIRRRNEGGTSCHHLVGFQSYSTDHSVHRAGSQLTLLLSPRGQAASDCSIHRRATLSSADEIKSAWLAPRPSFLFPAFVWLGFYQRHHRGLWCRSKTRGRWPRKTKCLDTSLHEKIIFSHSSQNLKMCISFK